MSLNDALSGVVLSGENFSPLDSDRLRKILGSLLPEWFCTLCESRRLVGMEFSIDDTKDKSGLGVEMKWMDANSIAAESEDLYPGKVAVHAGYLPFGTCLEGSGDPYFLRLGIDDSDSGVVRIPHDCIVEDTLDESRVELVSDRLCAFLKDAGVFS